MDESPVTGREFDAQPGITFLNIHDRDMANNAHAVGFHLFHQFITKGLVEMAQEMVTAQCKGDFGAECAHARRGDQDLPQPMV